MNLPLRIEPGIGAYVFYLCDAQGNYLVRSMGSTPEAVAALERLRDSANASLDTASLERRLRLAQGAAEKHHEGNRAACARMDAAFERMPDRPSDMESPEGLAAYAEAVLQWRTDCGYPERYAEVRG